VALVSGGSHGIGKMIAAGRILLKNHLRDRVVVNGRSIGGGEQLR
jgi:hypothetical protein